MALRGYGRSRRRGQALVELAILLPVLLLILGATIDLTRLFTHASLLQGAAREGLRVAATGGTDAQVAEAVRAHAASLPPQDVSVAVTPSARTAGQEVKVVVNAPMAVLTPIVSAITGPVVDVKGQGVMRAEKSSP